MSATASPTAQSPSQLLPVQNLSLSEDIEKAIIEELSAQCPMGHAIEFRELMSKIMPNRMTAPEEESVNKEEEEEEAKESVSKEEQAIEKETEEQATEKATEEQAIEKEEENEQSQDSNNESEESTTQSTGPLSAYFAELFPQPAVTLLTHSSTRILFSAHKLNPSNFWGVGWHSEWQQDSTGTWNGTVNVSAHFYEDGNVQLHATRAFKSEHGQSLVPFIQSSEDSLQMSLNEAYQQLADVSFKRLRRQLPITRQKMDWSKYVNYKLSSELKSESGKDC